MGQRFSKSTSNGTNRAHQKKVNRVSTKTIVNTFEESKYIPIPSIVGPTINLQIQESPSTTNSQLHNSNSSSLISVNKNCPRQIIIKIQLAKMENGNDQQFQHKEQEIIASSSLLEKSTDTNLNSIDTNAQILNVTLNRNVSGDLTTTSTITAPIMATAVINRTAGSSSLMASTSTSILNNNLNANSVIGNPSITALVEKIDDIRIQDKLEATEYCEVLEESTVDGKMRSMTESIPDEENHLCIEEIDANSKCCRRKSKSLSAYLSKRRCKCTFRRILDPSSKTLKNKDRKENKHSNNTVHVSQQQQQKYQCNSNPIASSANFTSRSIATTQGNNCNVPGSNQLSIWTPTTSDVIIPISSPQLVVVQCPSTSVVTLERYNDNAIHLRTTEIVDVNNDNSNIVTINSQSPSTVVKSLPNGPIVHSQVDFVHCLVPDLEKITNSSFYWGKMDRYEAERLLEDKPEGTFLLRDSAQEEYLFSVTFRKYGRSLHARIEQSGHKFSFDCHDSCIFNAPTVTGLLEHYKDPISVMFFEPMLTIPLHRKTTFSLQQLCRATIVSHTTYDGVSQLELPARLKSYLKEYHYKQKLRVKRVNDELFYSRI